MKITVKLFATLREFLPEDAVNAAFGVDVEARQTVRELLKRLKLPEDLPKIVLVNGQHTAGDTELREGDTVSIFPPLVGGEG